MRLYRNPLRLWIVILVVIVAASAVPTAAAGSGSARDDALERALAAGRISGPQYAFERARSLFALAAVRATYGDVAKPGPRDATLILRDLVVALPRLSQEQQRSAEALLARPTDGASDFDGYRVARKYFRHRCTTRFCIHWVTRSSDAPSLVNRNGNRLPDWIDKVRSVMANVWNVEIGRIGYRKPRNDRSSGGHRGGNPNSKLDVFVADVGRNGIYGYCTTDDPAIRIRNNVSAYCVLDNNFSRRQFSGAAHGVDALRITAAHEFHHSSQFNYDIREDRWAMEGTATNMEATVYPAIHDNYQFFSSSPLSRIDPTVPIDYFDPISTRPYGVWIFFRFLSEYFTDPGHPITTKPDPRIVREFWQKTAAIRGTRKGGLYAIQAVRAAIAARGETFRQVFAEFGAANAMPGAWYKDGAAYPTAGARDADTIGAGESVPGDVSMDHLSNDYVVVRPGATATHLDITVNFPDPADGANATVLVFYDGRIEETRMLLDASGAGTLRRLDFAPATVKKVVLVLTNDGARFSNCGGDRRFPTYSCSGKPLSDFLNNEFVFDLAAS
jgi:hypothetical protein